MERRTALVTGASRGIGNAIAWELASSGFDLYLTCNHNEKMLLNQADKIMDKYGNMCKCYCFSVSDEEKMGRTDVKLIYSLDRPKYKTNYQINISDKMV